MTQMDLLDELAAAAAPVDRDALVVATYLSSPWELLRVAEALDDAARRRDVVSQFRASSASHASREVQYRTAHGGIQVDRWGSDRAEWLVPWARLWDVVRAGATPAAVAALRDARAALAAHDRSQPVGPKWVPAYIRTPEDEEREETWWRETGEAYAARRRELTGAERAAARAILAPAGVAA